MIYPVLLISLCPICDNININNIYYMCVCMYVCAPRWTEQLHMGMGHYPY